jgi:sulfate adenylyltransferase subunit 1 (EFTu-like GTPase family)
MKSGHTLVVFVENVDFRDFSQNEFEQIRAFLVDCMHEVIV